MSYAERTERMNRMEESLATLLHIDSSALRTGSVSREIAATFRSAWADKHPDGVVIYRDLGAEPVPHLDQAGITARMTPPDDRNDEQLAAAALQEELVSELEWADAYLFTVPMYNFSVPSSFKAWLDHVIIVGRTMAATPEQSSIAGRPATVIASRGGSYAPGTPREGWDFAQPFLEKVLRDTLGLDVTFIVPELTLAHVNPAMTAMRDAADASRLRAHEAAMTSAHAAATRIAD